MSRYTETANNKMCYCEKLNDLVKLHQPILSEIISLKNILDFPPFLLSLFFLVRFSFSTTFVSVSHICRRTAVLVSSILICGFPMGRFLYIFGLLVLK